MKNYGYANTNLKARLQSQQKKKIRKIKFYHSFLTIVLLVCLLEVGYSALLNLAKIVVYQTKILKAQDLKAQAQKRNNRLKADIQNFSSMAKIESIARNNLKMAAKDEVLIIINQPQQEEIVKTDEIQNNKIVEFFESFSSKFNRDLVSDKSID